MWGSSLRFWVSDVTSLGVYQKAYVVHDGKGPNRRCVLVIEHDYTGRASVAMLPWECEAIP